MKRIETLLIANRGEIALRVMRTARAMGIRSVAVYSDADAHAPHVHFADAALHIGPAPVAESYLDADAILAAARLAGADAIHPGYGFLSENADFARAVEQDGMVFVGPTPSAITAMGDKARAKRIMIEAGVPCVPGYEGEDQNDARFLEAAADIGFPVMVKASAGGGGRGMRLVDREEALSEALPLARSEALNAFGSGDLILEKAVVAPRHVEFQVFADEQGNTIHLGERDCSVQRRHQKVLEESPCPVMSQALRESMGAAAVAAAKAVNYRGAGTVEFLLDADRNFYFLEMNTRLQVEHPVTELVTGLDLVELQIRVARGEPLGLEQDEVVIGGHAIEARLYAEDPAEGFQPATGPVLLYQAPEGEGIRCDDGIASGGEVTPYYDAMVAKIMAWGESREDALHKVAYALRETTLFGVKSNQAFLAAAVDHPAFREGRATTAFVSDAFGQHGFSGTDATPEDHAAAAVLLLRERRDAAHRASLGVAGELLDWSSSLPRPSTAVFGERVVQVSPIGSDTYTVVSGDDETQVEVRAIENRTAKMTIDGRPVEYVSLVCASREIYLRRGAMTFHLHDSTAQLSADAQATGGGHVVANMHGVLVELSVAAGDRVSAGDKLAVLEAMKMQHQLHAQVDGTVSQVAVAAGQQLASGDLIMIIGEVADAGGE
ncbi:MAG: acetyl-CoA carboxylase biotin carboxylase subunit [Pseudomonadota bacterium]